MNHNLILNKKDIYKVNKLLKQIKLVNVLKTHKDDLVNGFFCCVLDNLEIIEVAATKLLEEIFTDINFKDISAIEYLLYLNIVFEANLKLYNEVVKKNGAI